MFLVYSAERAVGATCARNTVSTFGCVKQSLSSIVSLDRLYGMWSGSALMDRKAKAVS